MNWLEEWSIKTALSKVSRRSIPWIVGLITGPLIAGKVNAAAHSFGITVNIDPMVLSGSLGAALSGVANWLKVKTGWAWL